MNSTIEKTDEQIAKDKAAVEAMKNAKSNMDAALQRIALLESRLRSVQEQCRHIGKAFGDSAYFNVWQHNNAGGGWAVRKASDIFRDIDNTIAAVL